MFENLETPSSHLFPVAEVCFRDGVAQVVANRAIFHKEADGFRKIVAEALSDASTHQIQIDLTNAVGIDSTTLAVLVEGWQSAQLQNKGFILTNPNERLQKIFSFPSLSCFEIVVCSDNSIQ